MRSPLRCLLLAFLPGCPLMAQFPVIDIGSIKQAIELTSKANAQLEQARAFRAQLDAQVAALTAPFATLHLQSRELATSALSLPGTLGTPPAIGAALQARVNNPAAGYATLAAPTAAQVRAAVTDSAAGDPLHRTPGGARTARDLAALQAAQTALAERLAADQARWATEARSLGTALNALTRATAAGTALESSTAGSWTAWSARQAAALHTVTNLQSKTLELHAAGLAREIAAQQDGLREAARARTALVTAAADSKTAFANYMATDRADGDELLESCMARLFTGGCQRQ